MTYSMKNYRDDTAKAKVATPQTKRTPGRTDEVKNNATGFVFEISARARLQRLMILGSVSNTYYVSAQDQTEDAFAFIKNAILDDEALVRQTMLDISLSGRAFRQTMVNFTAAMLLLHGTDYAENREAAVKVARTATQLFEVCSFIDTFGGWGSGKRKFVQAWFDTYADKLPYQAIKYRSRAV